MKSDKPTTTQEDQGLKKAHEKAIKNISNLIKERENYEQIAREIQPLFSDFNKAVLSENIADARTLLTDLTQYINRFSLRVGVINDSKPLSTEVEEWVSMTQDDFHYSTIDKDLVLMTKNDKQNRAQILTRMVKARKIRRIPGRHGWYRRITVSEIMDWWEESAEPLDISLPLKVHSLVEILPTNIIAIAGEKSAGKTAWCLDCAKRNRDKFKVLYFNSEMGRRELKKRLDAHEDMDTEEWRKIEFYPRPQHIADEINPDALNIIDFLQLKMDKTYQVGDKIEEIHEAMIGGQGVAVVALQKDPGRSLARGGPSSLDKPRLYLTMDKGNRTKNGIIRIFEAKCWKDTNPNGMIMEYKIVKGANIFGVGVWHDEY